MGGFWVGFSPGRWLAVCGCPFAECEGGVGTEPCGVDVRYWEVGGTREGGTGTAAGACVAPKDATVFWIGKYQEQPGKGFMART
jgi:hypothetical protein